MSEKRSAEETVFARNRDLIKLFEETTEHLGSIDIYGNNVVCRISKKKLSSYFQKYGRIFPMNDLDEETKKYIRRKYNRSDDFKIQYIFNDCCFHNVSFTSKNNNGNLYFDNCSFGGYIDFEGVNEAIFVSTFLPDDSGCGIYLYNHLGGRMKSLKLIDCSFGAKFDGIPTALNMHADADRIYVNNSNFNVGGYAAFDGSEVILLNSDINASIDISVNASDLTIEKTKFSTDKLHIDSDSMKMKDQEISTVETTIDNKNCDIGEFNTNVNAAIYYNGIQLKPNKKYVIIPETYKLFRERAKLAHALYEVNKKCEDEINAKMRVLKNKSVTSTLKNK